MMSSRNYILSFVAMVSTSIALLACLHQPTWADDLPLHHWAYEYLERMKTKGVLDGFLNATRPLSRAEMALAVSQVQAASSLGDPRITPVERRQLEWLQMEFAGELLDLGVSVDVQDRHLFSWSDESRAITLDVASEVNGRLGKADGQGRKILDLRAEGRVRGHMGERLSFGASVAKGEVSTDLDRVTGEVVGVRGYFNSQGAIGYYDWSHAHLSLHCRHLELQMGRQPVDWGPGLRGNVALSSYPPAYDYVSLRARFGRVKFVFLHGFLISEVVTEIQTQEGFLRRQYAQKYVAAHRLEADLFRGVHIGLTESIVYGERDVDLAYLNPLVFFWSAQHSSHDRDNETLSADIEIVATRGLRMYGAVFVDEIYLQEIFADDARNKIAIQGGLHLVDPLGIDDSDLRLEYARVQPCVYTHKYQVNTYRHDGYALGHWLEQNGDDVLVMASRRLSRHLRVQLQASQTRHGQKGELPWCHAEPARYSFLEGVVERVRLLAVSVHVEPIKDLQASVSYCRTTRRNKGHVSGVDEVLDELALGLSFDY